MKTSLVISLSGLFLSAFVSTAVHSESAGVQADLKRGADLAQRQCMACHNVTMLTMVTIYPSLNGQKPAYLFKQLTDIKAGKRVSAIMKPQVSNLTEQDFRDVAGYFGSLEPINIKSPANK